MPKPKQRRTDLQIAEISLVDDGDNPPADALLAKRKEELMSKRSLYRKAVDSMRDVLGRNPDAETQKRLFDEVVESQSKESAFSAILSRADAFVMATEEILFFDDNKPTPDMLIQNAKQFAGSIEKDAAEILAGKLMKEFPRDGNPPPEDFSDRVVKILTELSQSPAAGADDENRRTQCPRPRSTCPRWTRRPST